MTTSDIWVDTKTFYTRVDAQTDNNLIGRLKDMDEEISEFIYQNHGRTPDTKVTVTTAMGEGLYAVTVVITSPDYEEEYRGRRRGRRKKMMTLKHLIVLSAT